MKTSAKPREIELQPLLEGALSQVSRYSLPTSPASIARFRSRRSELHWLSWDIFTASSIGSCMNRVDPGPPAISNRPDVSEHMFRDPSHFRARFVKVRIPHFEDPSIA